MKMNVQRDTWRLSVGDANDGGDKINDVGSESAEVLGAKATEGV
jgi:hypothetical protein